MKVYQKGWQIVIITDIAPSAKHHINTINARMDITDGVNVKIWDELSSTRRQFICPVASLKNEAGAAVGNLAAVETYLCAIIGSHVISS